MNPFKVEHSAKTDTYFVCCQQAVITDIAQYLT